MFYTRYDSACLILRKNCLNKAKNIISNSASILNWDITSTLEIT